MTLVELRQKLVHDLRLATQSQWDSAIKRFGAPRAEADQDGFLKSLSKVKVAIGKTRRSMLSEHQRLAILDSKDLGTSLVRKNGEFILLDLIGEGGYGSVFTAIRRNRTRPDELVALKCVPIPKLGSISHVRLKREMQLLCDEDASKHRFAQYVVRGIETFSEGGQAHLVMTFQNGKTFHDIINECNVSGRRLTVRQAMLLTDAVLKGVESLHDREIIHRDIKPKNVIYNPDIAPYFACVVDLGIVKHMDEPVTAESIQMGTPYYRPPECCVAAHTANAASDLYGIAATFYFLICGEPPAFALFLNINASKLSAKVVTDTQQLGRSPDWSRMPLSQIRSEVPASISELIFRTLEPANERRPQSVAEFRREFDPVLVAIEHVRRIQKRLPAFRSGIRQAVSGVVTESEKRLYPVGDNARAFVLEVRRQLERCLKDFQVSPLLFRSAEFNGLLKQTVEQLDSLLKDIELKAPTYAKDDAMPGRPFANDLEQFQKTLPDLLALQHQFSMCFAGVV